MRVDVLARDFGTPAGAPHGMAMAAGFFAETLERLGHQVRRLGALDGFGADLVITTVHQHWRRHVAAAVVSGAHQRLVYWHHSGGLPDGHGAILAAPPAIAPTATWSRHVVLPPSSWAAEAGGERTGAEILVPGAATAKGGYVALEVARLCPDLRWLVLQGRSSVADRAAWGAIATAEVAHGILPPSEILARARAVLAPTRFEVHPLILVEAAARGIPIVCTDMPATREAARAAALYLPMNAPPAAWAGALREALEMPPVRVRPRPYAEVVAEALDEMQERRAAA